MKLSTVGTPKPTVSETNVKRAEAPRLLEYNWGDQDLRWEIEPLGAGTRLTLWHNIDRLKFGGWQRLNAEYATQFGVETPGWPSHPRT